MSKLETIEALRPLDALKNRLNTNKPPSESTIEKASKAARKKIKETVFEGAKEARDLHPLERGKQQAQTLYEKGASKLPGGVAKRIPFAPEKPSISPFTIESVKGPSRNQDYMSEDAQRKLSTLKKLIDKSALTSREVNGKSFVHLQEMMDTVHHVRFDERAQKIEEATYKISVCAELLNEIRLLEKNSKQIDLSSKAEALTLLREDLGLKEGVFVFEGDDTIDRLKVKIENCKGELQQFTTTQMTYLDAQIKTNSLIVEVTRSAIEKIDRAIEHMLRAMAR